jgi:hypothetical protein
MSGIPSAIGAGVGVFDRFKHFLDRRRDERERRVGEVVEGFGRIIRDGERDGVRAFLRAGAKELKSSDEVRDAVDRIVGRHGTAPHPLGRNGAQTRQLPDLRKHVQGLDPDQDHDPPDYEIMSIGGRR